MKRSANCLVTITSNQRHFRLLNCEIASPNSVVWHVASPALLLQFDKILGLIDLSFSDECPSRCRFLTLNEVEGFDLVLLYVSVSKFSAPTAEKQLALIPALITLFFMSAATDPPGWPNRGWFARPLWRREARRRDRMKWGESWFSFPQATSGRNRLPAQDKASLFGSNFSLTETF
jgi:hypothetical protein